MTSSPSASSPSNPPVLVLSVPGMSCGHCEAAITSEVSAVEGVTSVVVDLETKAVTVLGSADRQRVVDAIGEAGFDVDGNPVVEVSEEVAP